MVSASEQSVTVISDKGQIALPKTIRDRQHWAAGTRLIIENTADGVLLKSSPFPPTTIAEVFGSLAHPGPALSVEEMNTVIETEAKRRARD